jgi:N-glycosylase/DNA lyase
MTETSLLSQLRLLLQSDVHTIVQDRATSFHAIQQQPPDALFLELCYCLLTANCKADHCLTIQHTLGATFLHGTEHDIKDELRNHHYRFPPRASRIIAARKHKDTLLSTLQNLQGEDRRRWLVDTISGLGYKEASHFLRNIGFDDYAIIDTHILDLLTTHEVISPLRTLTPRRYLDIETKLRGIAQQAGLTLAELDLYLWHLETGKIIK